MTINLELEKFYMEDTAERGNLDYEDMELMQTFDSRCVERIEKTKEIIENKEFDESEIWNLHYAAYILHHSDNEKDNKTANELAKKAVNLGSSVTKWLYAATLDRYLLSQGKKQKYGTQYKFEDNEWKPQPVEESTTDDERSEYGVKPLKEYLSAEYK